MSKVRKIANALGLPDGYSLRQCRDGHWQIVTPTGTPLRTETGLPMSVSSSPSDWRSRLNERSRIQKAIRAGGAS